MDDMWYTSNDGSRQTCIQCHPHNKNKFTDGCGSISRLAPLTENDYNMLNTGYITIGGTLERAVLFSGSGANFDAGYVYLTYKQLL